VEEALMRGAKSLLVLLVVAAGLGAYAYFVESERDLADPATRREKVFTVETGKIEEVEVRAIAGDVTTIRKTGSDWQIVSPMAAAADQSAASSLVSTLESLEMQKTLEDNPASVSAYGLDPPRFSVAFKAAGTATPHRLNIGNKTPTGSDLYARVEGQPRLFLISGYLEDTLSRTTFDLRDKAVLKFSRDTTDLVRLEAPGSPQVTLARKGTDWRLTAPIETRADSSPVDALLNRASQGQMTSIVAGESGPPSAADLKKFGFDRPQLLATFGAGSTTAALAIGAKKDDTAVYVRDLSKPLIFTVETSFLNDLKKGPADFRVKDVFEFKSFTAQSIDITRAGTTMSFAKSKPAGGDASAAEVWKQTQPEAKDVNQTGMTDLLNTLSSFRATTFADRPVASGEEVIVSARSGDAAKPVEERVTFRKSGDVVHAIRPNEPGAAVVPTADFDKALSQLKELTGTK
jgi:hypothetical protein